MSDKPIEKSNSAHSPAMETTKKHKQEKGSHMLQPHRPVSAPSPDVFSQPNTAQTTQESTMRGVKEEPNLGVMYNIVKEDKLIGSEHVSKSNSPPRQPQKLKKKPIAYLTLLEEDLILGPKDVVIGPLYVLEPLAKRMDEECQEYEPVRQKKIETEHKASTREESYKHGFRRKPFTRRIMQGRIQTKLKDTLSCYSPSRSSLKHLNTGLKQKTAPTYNRRRTFQTGRLKDSSKGFPNRFLQKIGRTKTDKTPHFFNTSRNLDEIALQPKEVIMIQYSSSLMRLNRVHVKNVQVNMLPRKNNLATNFLEKASDLLGFITVVPHWEFYFLALILIVPIGIVLI
jgi:hypothetical protein